MTSIIYLIGFGWALLILPITQTFAHSLFAGAAISSLILGFASQQLFSNLINGVYPVIVIPFKIVDLVQIQDNTGHVRVINLNSTIIEDNDQKKIIIPSSLILNNVIVILKETDMK
ncbi:MAG TPA: mechanosensitive ion channel [Saprospiraceae bacterium]|nr:mechanosensitive ion channel [Saprospiraceae bacterium]